jgi:hypothetical protein
LPTILSAIVNSAMPQTFCCRAALAACASGSAAGGPPFHHRAAERRRAFGLRPAIGRCAAPVACTFFVATSVPHRCQRCIGANRCAPGGPSPSHRFLSAFAARPRVVASRVQSPRRARVHPRFVDPARALTLRSTGRAGTRLDLRRASRRRAGYLQR